MITEKKISTLRSICILSGVALLISIMFPSYQTVKKYSDLAAQQITKETGRVAVGIDGKFHLWSLLSGCKISEVSVSVLYFKDADTQKSSKEKICFPLSLGS